MRRSFLEYLAEGLATTDPFAYSYYLAWKRQNLLDAEVEPDPSPPFAVAIGARVRPRGRGEELPA
jgi:hypothetical protein